MPQDYRYTISDKSTELELVLPHVALLVGKPRTGKSVFMNYLTHQLMVDQPRLPDRTDQTQVDTKTGPAFDYVVVVSPTVLQNRDYDWLDDSFKHTEFNSALLQRLFETQQKNKSPRCLLIMDDAVGNKEMNGNDMKRLMTTYRHWNITVWLSVQYLNQAVPTVIRDCCTMVLWGRMTTKRSIDAMYESFGMSRFSRNGFEALLRQIKRHEFVLHRPYERDDEYVLVRAPFPLPKFYLEYEDDEESDNDENGGARKQKDSATEKVKKKSNLADRATLDAIRNEDLKTDEGKNRHMAAAHNGDHEESAFDIFNMGKPNSKVLF